MNQEVHASQASQSQHMNHLMATAGEVSGDGKQWVMWGVGEVLGTMMRWPNIVTSRKYDNKHILNTLNKEGLKASAQCLPCPLYTHDYNDNLKLIIIVNTSYFITLFYSELSITTSSFASGVENADSSLAIKYQLLLEESFLDQMFKENLSEARISEPRSLTELISINWTMLRTLISFLIQPCFGEVHQSVIKDKSRRYLKNHEQG